MTTAGLSPLDTILKRLQPIPSLGALLSLFEEPEYMALFLDLVDEYLPDWRAEILSYADTGDKIGIFIREFSRAYFEISDDWVQSIFEGDYDGDDESPSLFEGLVRWIPLETIGFTEDDYHEFQYKDKGFQMLLSLLACPFDVPSDFSCHGLIPRRQGLRIPLLEEMKKLVGKELAARIPIDGWSLEEVHALVDGTDYAGLGDFADWVNHETGCIVLDFTWEDYRGDPWEWNRETVDRLTREDKLAQEKTARWEKVAQWLEEDPRVHFSEMLDYMLGKKLPGPPAPKTLMEVFADAEE